MNLLNKTINSLFKAACEKTSVNTVKDFFANNRVKMCSTAVAKIQIRRLRPDPGSSTTIKWVLLAVPITSFGLGTWQVFRKFEKEKTNEEFLEKIDQPPVDFPKNLDELEGMNLRKVRVKGKFDHSREVYIGPRTKFDINSFKQPVYLLSRSNPGYLIITPFTLSDRGLTILVNRGWVPADKKPPSKRPEGQITGEVEFVGLVRNNQSLPFYDSENLPENKLWAYRNLSQMAEATGAAPICIDADLESSVAGGPIGGQTVIQLRNNHLSYIYTWYGLCAVTFYMWCVKYFPKSGPLVIFHKELKTRQS